MDSLRFTLFLIGLVVIVSVYFKFRTDEKWLLSFFQKFTRKKITTPETVTEEEDDLIPVLTPIDDEPDVQDFEQLNLLISNRDSLEDIPDKVNKFSPLDDVAETGTEQMLVVMFIMPPKGHVFSGEGVHAVMTSAGLVLSAEYKVYDYLSSGQVLFSIANAVEPGTFDKNNLASFTTPGLAVFMQLPGPVECRKALDTLIEVSTRISDALSGELCDEHRNPMTRQTQQHLKEKIETYRLKQKVSQRK